MLTVLQLPIIRHLSQVHLLNRPRHKDEGCIRFFLPSVQLIKSLKFIAN